MDIVCKIEALFARRGGAICRDDGGNGRGVTALAHALQCAQLAEWAHADTALVAAALLHDLGQLIDGAPAEAPVIELHEVRALTLLSAGGFGAAVTEPIRLHEQARRLLAEDGTPVNAQRRLCFLARPHAAQALRLSRWDMLARHPGKRTPPLAYYLNLLDDLLLMSRPQRRIALA
ncbi:MAG: HD domain-containing protein [Burkholderiaceae bacterium]